MRKQVVYFECQYLEAKLIIIHCVTSSIWLAISTQLILACSVSLTSYLQTRPSMFTLVSCFLVPIIMISVLLSFMHSLSLIIHDRIACMHCSIASLRHLRTSQVSIEWKIQRSIVYVDSSSPANCSFRVHAYNLQQSLADLLDSLPHFICFFGVSTLSMLSKLTLVFAIFPSSVHAAN